MLNFDRWLIGKPPMVYLNTVVKGCNTNVATKLEIMEPCCSVRTGGSDQRIGFAFISASREYKLKLMMLTSMSIDRRLPLKAFGAELVPTVVAKGIKGLLGKATEILKKKPKSYILEPFCQPFQLKGNKDT
jgi:cysteine synthase A